jgi:hypothetical protein
MKKIVLALTMFLAVTAAAQTGCTTSGGVTCTGNLNLWLLPPHYTNWGVPWNANATAVDTLAGAVVLKAPTASQTVTQPYLTYTSFNAPFVFGTVPVLRFGVAAGTFDSALTRTGAGAFSLDAGTIGSGGATLSLAGLTVGGSGGTIGQCLGSNGTIWNTPINCVTSIGSIYYQTVQFNNSPVAQAAALNFTSPLTVTPASGNTTIGISKTGTENEVVTASAAGTNGNCVQWNASGGAGDSGAPCRNTYASHGIVAVWNGASGVLVDSGNGGSAWQSGATSWGTVIAGSYQVICTTTGWPSGSYVGDVVGWSVVGTPINDIYFYFGVNGAEISRARGYTLPSVTCIAVQ